MTRIPRLLAVLVVAPLLLLGACDGDSDDGEDETPTQPTGPPDDVVSLSSVDIGFEPKALSAKAGLIEIRYRNGGEAPHTFLIEGMYEVFMEVEFPGETDSYKVRLDPGTYTFYCDVPGHRAAGMEGTLTVT